MISIAKPLLILVTLLATAFPAVAQELSSLEEQMTGSEFERAGLEKLTPQELRFLNEWLQGKRLAPGPGASPAAPAGSSPAASTPAPRAAAVPDPDAGFELRRKRSTITSRIDGKFTGWSGKTQFVLENGMVWRQAESGRYGSRTLENPEVRIEPKLGGSWRLYVEGLNRSLKVSRVK